MKRLKCLVLTLLTLFEMPKYFKTAGVRLSEEEHKAFKEYCLSQGISVNKELKDHVSSVLKEKKKDDFPEILEI